MREKEYDNLEYFVKEWETYQSKPSDPYDDYFKKDTIMSQFFSYINPLNLFNKNKSSLKKKLFL